MGIVLYIQIHKYNFMTQIDKENCNSQQQIIVIKELLQFLAEGKGAHMFLHRRTLY